MPLSACTLLLRCNFAVDISRLNYLNIHEFKSLILPFSETHLEDSEQHCLADGDILHLSSYSYLASIQNKNKIRMMSSTCTEKHVCKKMKTLSVYQHFISGHKQKSSASPPLSFCTVSLFKHIFHLNRSQPWLKLTITEASVTKTKRTKMTDENESKGTKKYSCLGNRLSASSFM